MEKLARKLARNISSTLSYDEEKEAVIAYGLMALIQVSATVLLVLLLGLAIGAPVEAMIVCFSASILRKYSGGAHADTAELCTLISGVYCTLTAFLSKHLLASIYSPAFMAAAALIVFILSFIIVYRFAPVDSPNKPIKTVRKRQRMRKGSLLILGFYVALSVTFFILSYKYGLFRSYGISMLFGVSWQVFTLTQVGNNFIERLNHILIARKGVSK